MERVLLIFLVDSCPDEFLSRVRVTGAAECPSVLSVQMDVLLSVVKHSGRVVSAALF